MCDLEAVVIYKNDLGEPCTRKGRFQGFDNIPRIGAGDLMPLQSRRNAAESNAQPRARPVEKLLCPSTPRVADVVIQQTWQQTG